MKTEQQYVRRDEEVEAIERQYGFLIRVAGSGNPIPGLEEAKRQARDLARQHGAPVVVYRVCVVMEPQ